MQTTKLVRRNSLHLVLGTLISRCSGLVRELCTAFCFGTDPVIAAFFIAFRLTNFFRHFIAESSLSVGFIPHFETLRSRSEKKAIVFFLDLVATISVSGLVLGLFCGVSFLICNILNLNSLQENSILNMTLIMLPSLGMLTLYSLFMSLLNCFHRYFFSALAPIPFNLLFIITLFATRSLPREQAAYLLCIAVAIGYALQWAVLIPSTYKHIKPYLTRELFKEVRLVSNPVKALLGSWSLTLIGVGATQINGLCDMAIARFVSLEGPAYLTYAIRISQAPLALFGLTITAALMPTLSRAIAQKQLQESSHLFLVAFSSTLTLLIPCSLWLTLSAPAIIQMLYGYQQFSLAALQETSLCLSAYAIGLAPSGIVLFLAGAFYAQKNYLIPTQASLFSIALNLFGNFLFVMVLGLGTVSVALATSLAACGNTFFLLYALKKENSLKVPTIELLKTLGALSLASASSWWLTAHALTQVEGLITFFALPLLFHRLICLGFSFLLFCLGFALILYGLGFKHLLRLEMRKTKLDPTSLPSLEGTS